MLAAERRIFELELAQRRAIEEQESAARAQAIEEQDAARAQAASAREAEAAAGRAQVREEGGGCLRYLSVNIYRVAVVPWCLVLSRGGADE
eukprot:COSAG01_NODE_1038_length_11978_cov_4.983500_14_plen_91_part_00